MNLLNIILPRALIFFAALFKATMDRVETEIHFNDSVFYKWNAKFWSKVESANINGFLPFTSYRFDAWHICQTFWLGCFFLYALFDHSWLDICFDGSLYIIEFEILYGTILKRK